MEKLLNLEGVDEGDLNKTWAMLSQLRQSNPAKYAELIEYMKSGQEEFDRLDKMIPQPHSVYTVECTRLDQRSTCYVNMMSWERIKYPEPDQPISLLIGVELAKFNAHNDLVAHVAASPKVLSEITESDHETQKEFRRLLTKFMQDNYGEYRFYSNKMRLFERSNQQQYYGKLIDDPKHLFISSKKKKPFTVDDVIRREEEEKEEKEEEKRKQPQTLVEALEQEMKEAKLIEENEEEHDEKEEKVEKKKTLIVEVEKQKPLDKLEYVISDKHARYMTISIRLDPNIDMSAVRTITSPTKIKVLVPAYQPLELTLPANIKDEAVHAKFSRKKAYNILTIKAPRCGGLESSKEEKKNEEVFNETFCSNLQRAFSAQH